MIARVLALPESDGRRTALWGIGTVSAGLVVSFLLAAEPWLATGTAVGGLLTVVLLLRPRVIIGVMLAFGAIDLSFITGGSKALFPGLGGLDMNGIRLIGMVVGLAAIAAVDREFWRYLFRPNARWYLAFLVFAAGTLVPSMSRVDGTRFLFKLAFPLAIFVAVLGTSRTREDLLRYADWVLGGAAVIVLLLNPLFVLAGGYSVGLDGHLRIQGIGMHQNPFSFYLTAMLLLSFARYTVRGELRYLVLSGVIGVWLVLTITRISTAASMAGLMGMALYGAVVARNYRALAGAVLIGALVAVPLTPLVLERTFGHVLSLAELGYLLRHPMELYASMNWQGRQLLWPLIFDVFVSNPVVGTGLGSTSYLLRTRITGLGGVVHNEYLRLLAEVGLIGCTLYALAVVRWWTATIRAGRTEDPVVREFALPAFAVILAWALIAVTDNAFDYYAQFTQYVAFMCAGAVGAARMAEEDETTNPVGAMNQEPLTVDRGPEP